MSKKAKVKILPSVVGYDLAASVYDIKESYLNSFEKGKVVGMLGSVEGKKVLDVGAGTGRLSLGLAAAGAKITALDVSFEMLEVLKRKNAQIVTVVGDAESLPFEDGAFDIITAAFLIVHLKDPAIFFNEVYRVLKPGGKLLVTNINQKEPPEVIVKEGVIKIESYYHRPENIKEELEGLAFDIEHEEFVKENGVWINQIILAVK